MTRSTLNFLRFTLLPTIVALWSATIAASEASPDSEQVRRPKIGLVLGGGGARGAAHIGVIKRLEELNIQIDFITGTSMGAIIGGIYASGGSIEDIEEWLATADWRSLFSDHPDRAIRSIRSKREDFNYPRGQEVGIDGFKLKGRSTLVAGQKFIFELRKLTMPAIDITDFDNLPIPFRAVATDILTGDSVTLDHGSLAEALRASMAIPGLFSPIKRNGKVLVDGFLSNNLPVDLAQSMGADVIIAVNVTSALLSEDELNSPFAYTNQMISILSRKQERQQIALLGENDIYIHVPMPNQKSGNFRAAFNNIEPGYASAREQDDKLSTLSGSKPEFTVWNDKRKRPNDTPIAIDEINIIGKTQSSKHTIKQRLGLRSGDTLSMGKLERGLNRIYDLRTFELVDFSLRPSEKPGHHNLDIDPQDKSWGPNYLKFGVNLSSDLSSDSSFNLLLNYRQTQLNSLGAEFTAETQLGDGQLYEAELYQPLDASGRFFIAPNFQYYRQTVSDIRGGTIHGNAYGASIGLNLGSFAVLSATTARSRNKVRGVFSKTTKIIERTSSLNLYWDTLDNPYFPKSGLSYEIGASRSDGELVGLLDGIESKTYFGEIIWPITRGRSTILTTINIAGQIDGKNSLPILSNYSLGGFLSLSGTPEESIDGDSLFLSRLIYYYHLAEFAPMLGEGVYVGGSLEMGDAWNDFDKDSFDPIYAGSVFIGVDTFLGPLYFAYGRAKSGDDSMYFYLGQNF